VQVVTSKLSSPIILLLETLCKTEIDQEPKTYAFREIFLFRVIDHLYFAEHYSTTSRSYTKNTKTATHCRSSEKCWKKIQKIEPDQQQASYASNHRKHVIVSLCI
jgi:hypothetical protein